MLGRMTRLPDSCACPIFADTTRIAEINAEIAKKQTEAQQYRKEGKKHKAAAAEARVEGLVAELREILEARVHEDLK